MQNNLGKLANGSRQSSPTLTTEARCSSLLPCLLCGDSDSEISLDEDTDVEIPFSMHRTASVTGRYPQLILGSCGSSLRLPLFQNLGVSKSSVPPEVWRACGWRLLFELGGCESPFRFHKLCECSKPSSWRPFRSCYLAPLCKTISDCALCSCAVHCKADNTFLPHSSGLAPFLAMVIAQSTLYGLQGQ